MKYLLMFALLGVVWWMWVKRHSPGDKQASTRRDPPPEKMVTCSYCAVHLPESEGVTDGGRVYCCEAHRVAAQAGKS